MKLLQNKRFKNQKSANEKRKKGLKKKIGENDMIPIQRIQKKKRK